jgi:hypothetical protein
MVLELGAGLWCRCSESCPRPPGGALFRLSDEVFDEQKLLLALVFCRCRRCIDSTSAAYSKQLLLEQCGGGSVCCYSAITTLLQNGTKPQRWIC